MTVRARHDDSRQPAELRAFLRNRSDTLSETWTYLLPSD
jgi:glucans biosynthesis protein